MRGTTAVFLAGGRGQGLGVLTEHRAPAAVPFGGKYRLIDFSLSNCNHSEIVEVALLTQHAPTSLNEHVGSGRSWDLDRAQGGLRILQPFASRHRARWTEGPADALLRNLSEFDEAGTERLLVGSAEHVYLLDYSDLVTSHIESESPLSITYNRVAQGSVREARRIEVHNGRVRQLGRNKELVSGGELAAIGLFVFEMDFLRSAADARTPRTLFEWVAAAVERGVPVNAFEHEGFWADPVDLPTYYRTSMSLLASDPPLSLADPLWTVETHGEERPPARFLESSRVKESLVAGGCVVAGHVERSILFGGVVVEEGARVVDSIVFQDVRVGAGAALDHVIVDKSVDIGESALLGEGPWPVAVDELAALAVIGKEARLPARFRLARGGVVPVADRAMAAAR
ncbi:MAG TPA: sugar phosphate nucleotidyltransferase [Candidatus Eisenbacteria bacterium]|nr:sugar phosphate nucleotidyltransferase [Candidatus Eisenbacteria bacterium]